MIFHKASATIIMLLFVLFIVSCSGGKMDEQQYSSNSIKDLSDTAWEELSKRKIYFGHQSVGDNILDGVRDIMKENPEIKLNIVETINAADLTAGTLAHSKVGENTEPKTKIDAFVKHIEDGIGQKADAAALKLCYVDIMAEANPESLFLEYEGEIDKIRKAYPDLAIIHFTSPLTAMQTGPKAWIKKLIGRPLYGVKENMNRNKYNELIREKYQGKDPILDIATIESTYPDGTRSTFKVDGKTYNSMVPEYTNDGGHLNVSGRKKVAEELILLLSNLK